VFCRNPQIHKTDYYYYFIYIYNTIILCLVGCAYPLVAQAQDSEIRIANEYFLKGEKDKALTMYQSLAKNQENIPAIHNNYLNLMLDMGKYKEAEDYVEKVLRSPRTGSPTALISESFTCGPAKCRRPTNISRG